MEEIIRQMVQNQIRDILDHNRETISRIVKKSIMPELYKIVQDEIHREFLAIANIQSPLSDQDLTAKGSSDLDLQKENRHVIQQSSPNGQGKYLYCIVKGNEDQKFDQIGIDGNRVYPLYHKDLAAIIHDCTAKPYTSNEEKTVAQWVMTHQKVIEKAWETYGVVVPASFDTIIIGDKKATDQENLKKWLEDHHDDLLAKMEKFSGKAEYGIKVFWNANQMGERISRENEQIRMINEECRSKSKGSAYMYRKKLENLLKKELENKAEYYFKEFYNKIKAHVDDIKIDKIKNKSSDQQMIMNLACLMPMANNPLLGDALEKIDQMESFSVQYTGPWPPYSFV
ncbi:MAG: GvpL/GvpF family gas vesicle protein [Proteobacteria bacterium]|nr:GvpL/GvpF family gas vesicle protein [Pseudomonadota bacterium]MBU1583145.1 GvpL/GvpF family gas vesicle protein [Pseudomonadota bacterium]MBU2452612.1 GvpL/GvpF family gas vesicle protein [Pseudomonadota bacterium]MBU2627162.1 GvpL/GvpF family gas vesicle protein [Pseudomonadota bacterium]